MGRKTNVEYYNLVVDRIEAMAKTEKIPSQPNYLAQSAARIRARKERRYKAAPWERPNKRHEWGAVIHGADPDEMQLAGALATTGRVNEITGTIEIGGKVQEWRLSNRHGVVDLELHKITVMSYYDSLDEIDIFTPDQWKTIAKIGKPHTTLSPDPNFTPPGQYVEGANGMKFWVEQDERIFCVYMNDILLFGIVGASKHLVINYDVARAISLIKTVYDYHGCQCDECGGGE